MSGDDKTTQKSSSFSTWMKTLGIIPITPANTEREEDPKARRQSNKNLQSQPEKQDNPPKSPKQSLGSPLGSTMLKSVSFYDGKSPRRDGSLVQPKDIPSLKDDKIIDVQVDDVPKPPLTPQAGINHQHSINIRPK